MASSSPPRKRLRQTDIRTFLTRPLPTLRYIDFALHPVVVKQIFGHLPRRTLLHIRLVSRGARDVVDHILYDHLVLKPGHLLHAIDGPHPSFRWTKERNVFGYRRFWCTCCGPTNKARDHVRDALRNARVLDLRYLTDKSLSVLKRSLDDRCIPVVRLWMWCNKPCPDRLPFSVSSLVVFGWAGSWEPTNGYRRERYELPPLGLRKVVFNLQVSNTKVPLLFNGLFVKRTPPASLETVVFVFHSNWASDDRPSALLPLQQAIPRILQLITEARRRRPKTIFVNSAAILPVTFPLPTIDESKYSRFYECTSFEEYATAVYVAARGRDEFFTNVSFWSLEEYRALIGPELFRVETLG